MFELSRAILCTAQEDDIKLHKGGLQIFRDVTGEDLRGRQVLRVFQAFPYIEHQALRIFSLDNT